MPVGWASYAAPVWWEDNTWLCAARIPPQQDSRYHIDINTFRTCHGAGFSQTVIRGVFFAHGKFITLHRRKNATFTIPETVRTTFSGGHAGICRTTLSALSLNLVGIVRRWIFSHRGFSNALVVHPSFFLGVRMESINWRIQPPSNSVLFLQYKLIL